MHVGYLYTCSWQCLVRRLSLHFAISTANLILELYIVKFISNRPKNYCEYAKFNFIYNKFTALKYQVNLG